MRPIENFIQYKTLLTSVKQNGRALWSNCYLSYSQVQTYTSEKRLFFDVGPNHSLFIYLDRASHYQLYYYIPTVMDSIQIKGVHKPLVMELVYEKDAGGMPGDKILKQKHIWLEAGFSLRRESVRMSVARKDVPGAFMEPMFCSCSIRIAKAQDSKALSQLLSECFDPYCDYIPSVEQLRADLRENRFLAAYDGAGEVVGSLHFLNAVGCSKLEHLCVDEKFRGKKIATALMRAYLECLEAGILRLELWRNKENYIAAELYRSFGYHDDLRGAYELFL